MRVFRLFQVLSLVLVLEYALHMPGTKTLLKLSFNESLTEKNVLDDMEYNTAINASTAWDSHQRNYPIMVHNHSKVITPSSQMPFRNSSIPRLSEIIQGKKIVGDVQNLFHFAVAGFAKCGTTSLLNWLHKHPEICMPSYELIFLRKSPRMQISKLHKLVHSEKCDHGNKINGYKNPHDIQYPTCLAFYRKHAPKTKLIVTIRHPVRFFESFYNYRIVKGEMWAIKGKPNELIGGVDKAPYKVWSYSGAFHRYLVRLGKTAINTTEERSLLEGFMLPKSNLDDIPVVPNPIFLLESSQLSDLNETRREQLSRDMQQFLGLENPLPSVLPRSNARKKKSGPLDICDPQYSIIKQDTMNVARNASLWIRKYFLSHPDVHVSSREHIERLVEAWMRDPCENTTLTSTT